MRSLIGPPSRLRINSSFKLYLKALFGVFKKNYSNNSSIYKLEEKIATMVNRKFCIAVPMARTGLYITMKSCIKPGQEIILSPYTISDVVNMVVCAGLTPVFADIETHTCNVSISEVKKNISKKTGAVLITHFYGLISDFDELKKICSKNNILLIEDAAQAFGGKFKKKFSGCIGDVGVYSFGLYKNVNGFLGGAIVTNNIKIEKKIREKVKEWPVIPRVQLLKKIFSGIMIDLVTHPLFFKTFFFYFFRFCFYKNINFVNNKLKIDVNPTLKTKVPSSYLVKMSSIQSEIIYDQLNDNITNNIVKRINNAKLYHDNLKHNKSIILPPIKTDLSHSYWYYPIQVTNRKKFVEFALKKNRDITMSYHKNCAEMKCFSKWYRDCPNANKTANSVIYLPSYPRYSSKEVKKNILAFKDYQYN